MSTQDERYAFIAEWYDPNAALIRRYQFLYYPKDNTIEMYYVYLPLSLFGLVYKLLKIITLGMIKPDSMKKMGEILDLIFKNGFLITKMKKVSLSRNEALEFYQEHQSKMFFNTLIQYITSGPVMAFELMGENAVEKWRNLLGPTDSAEARSEAPYSIRARFGTDKTQNACHGSDSAASAARELEFFFPAGSAGRRNTAVFSDCTCGVIKPHAVLSGVAGQIINKILDTGFEISAIAMFHMERANAEEFYEVYKGVVQEYSSMVDELTSGPCIALEIRAQNAHHQFREMCGPADPEIARHLRPRTLRAMYGRDKVQNAIHCTDLPEDALLEVEYFFKILDR
ncbi:nucleoside diphosphate kinase 7-like [Lingula anatina]|uniref:Nucleoside diphosphate kinase 7-like n=1 Tax=Lingula anatina TaxID=7574 RepID=A0A1S3HGT8_LINAN|nr:nucleoside diphosphate kinase 7-like [Lingula anatina]|eukprot:XP_013384234.1 nucleoside diphosphate kinase 7-like [Lingula anatina]